MCASVPQPVASSGDSLREGDAFLRAGELDSARRVYEAFQKANPDSVEGRISLEYLDFLTSQRKSRYHFGEIEPKTQVEQRKERNLELMEEDFAAGRVTLRNLPTRGFIEHTTKCNFYCPHCSKGYDPYHAEDMSEDLVSKTMDSMLPTMTWACITGFGEPTIGSQYAPLMNRLVENGVRPHFNTNISTLTIPHIEQLVKCDAQITLSIDGASIETFETIRAGGSWEKTLESLHALKRLREIWGGKSWFDITFVAMRLNIHELPEMVRLTHRFNLDMLRVQDYHYHNIDFDTQSLRHEPDRANRFLDEARELADKLGVYLLLPPPYSEGAPPPEAGLLKKVLAAGRLFPKRNRFPQRCKAPWQEANIKVDGRVTPCCFSESIMGNLKEETFDQIWNGDRYKRFRRRIHSAVPPLECRWCHVHEGINNGNPNNTLLGEGLLLKIFYYFENKWVSRKLNQRKESEEKNYFKGKWIRSGRNEAPNP